MKTIIWDDRVRVIQAVAFEGLGVGGLQHLCFSEQHTRRTRHYLRFGDYARVMGGFLLRTVVGCFELQVWGSGFRVGLGEGTVAACHFTF